MSVKADLRAWAIVAAVLSGLAAASAGSDYDEFKVKRQETFEFTERPTVSRDGNRVTIRFASRGYCDVTVAIEAVSGPRAGRIVRHLAAGVLGPNAPAPFQKNALRQEIVWDGKDDQGVYIDDLASLTVRVSLGLRPRFERNLFFSPYKRMSNCCVLLAATEQGMLMFEGRGMDHVRLFDRQGEYVRTIYPFPSDKLDKLAGVETKEFPQDGQRLPWKRGFEQATLLTSGTSALVGLKYKFGDGFGATAMASANGRIALAYDTVNRLHLDGTTGGLPLTGSQVGQRAKWSGYGGQGGGEEIIGPASMAFSPDGKTLYLTGYMWREFYMGGADCYHVVLKVPFEGDARPEVFAGLMKKDDGYGSDDGRLKVPASVATDAQGRVYVADCMNDRIQVFSPEGKLLKSIGSPKPATVLVSPRDGQIWVFSWPVIGMSNKMLRETPLEWNKVKPTLTRYRSFDDPRKLSTQPLPIELSLRGFFLTGPMLSVAVDWWAEPATLWVAGRKYNVSRIDVAWGGVNAYGHRDRDAWMDGGIRLFQEKDGQWEVVRDFGELTRDQVVRVKPADFARQRLVVNPKDQMLYVLEDSGFSKSFYQMVKVDPASGKVSLAEMPWDAEEVCFDLDGRIYLRTDTLVARYDPVTWREVPWDYGEERGNVGFTTLGGSKRANVLAALPTPGVRPVCWHQGGMYVSPKGHLIVSCTSRSQEPDRRAKEGGPWETSHANLVGRPYTPFIYPGRVRWQEMHVWDAHGRLIYEDPVPGLHILNGIGIDRDDNVYVMSAANRYLDGKPYFNEMSGTVMKFKPKAARIVSSSDRAPVVLSRENWPKRHPDIGNGKLGAAWAEGAEWFYGGVGFDGFNPSHSGGGCACWNSRFCIDLFGRSFAPEVDHYSVAVLDTAGNLILRVGRYGNLDDGRPLDAASSVPHARSLGGDEVGLFHACYVGTHSDRRLFIADAGNGRIVGVRLDYHATEQAPLKGLGPR